MQMHAFFRIIQDDHPTLPENISELLKHFLLLCFIKNPINRPTAKDLLNHPWIVKGKRNSIIGKGQSGISLGDDFSRNPNENIEESNL